MNLLDIERALLNFSRLDPDAAREMYPILTAELLTLYMGDAVAPRQAASIQFLLEDLRLEKNERLVEEARKLIRPGANLRVVGEKKPE